MSTIKSILMQRDGLSRAKADELIEEAKVDLASRLEAGEHPEDICEEWFGLEPDYIVELISCLRP